MGPVEQRQKGGYVDATCLAACSTTSPASPTGATQPWRFGLSRHLGRCSRSRSSRSCSKSPNCSLASTTTPCSSTPSNWCARGLPSGRLPRGSVPRDDRALSPRPGRAPANGLLDPCPGQQVAGGVTGPADGPAAHLATSFAFSMTVRTRWFPAVRTTLEHLILV